MRLGAIIGAFAGLALLGSAQPQDASAEKLREISQRSINYRSYPQGRVVEWEGALRKALATKGPVAAADALAPVFGLKPGVMRELVRLWIAVEIDQFDFDEKPAAKDNLRAALRALAASSREPLVLQIAAERLDDLDECRKDDFDALMFGSKDRVGDAWLIANAATCTENFVRYLKIAPDRPAPALIRMMTWSMTTPERLPVHAWLTSPAGLAHVSEADRPKAAAILYRDYALALFKTGLTDRAVALLDGLSPEMRAATLSDTVPASAEIDGLTLVFSDWQPDTALSTFLAAAYALAGRKAEADALFAKNRDIVRARQSQACAQQPDAGDEDPKCKRRGRDPDMGVLILDHYLNRLGEDPYLLAESLFGSSVSHSSDKGPMAEITCRVFAEPQYADRCDAAREATLDAAHEKPTEQDRKNAELARASIDALALPGLAEFRTDLRAALDATGPAPATTPSYARASIDPDPSPFAEQPLPAAYRGARPKAGEWPKDVAELPEGYYPVRLDRAGQRATAISISESLDPTGEISQGGYWVHLSEDGGRTWQAPLYTGLAQMFPYVVRETSRMPLRDGDMLNLEVEVALIDTASISYPPVGLRTRRKASGLYLKIPLAELRRDTDGDGITDIAAKHLLLDRARSDGGTPFVVGTDPAGSCRTPPGAERLAIQSLLLKIFELPSTAIIEPIDRKPDAPLALGWTSKGGAAMGRPVLIKGDPRDFACLNPGRLMVVYGEKDVEALQRHTPDFRTVELPRIVYNRAHDRGYVIWSAGWVGGTYRLRLVNGKWEFDAISSWIT